MMKWWGWGSIDKLFPVHDKPGLWPFLLKYGIEKGYQTLPIQRQEIRLPKAKTHAAFEASLKAKLENSQLLQDDDTRLLHAYGKSYRDLLRARSGDFSRIPDLVVYPKNSAEVTWIMQAANQYQIPIIPFGGGTNIVGATEVNFRHENMVITINMQRMNRVLSIDKYSQIATIEAGILGPDLEAELNKKGFSLGHFPDSFEFSTLGGWLATRSAGMQSDRYGKIEDLVVSMQMITPTGTINTPLVPKASTGPDLAQIILGSEGTLGIITQATMKIHPLKNQEYRGLIFKDFASGVATMHDCMQNNCMPETMRLSNDDETALGFALRAEHDSSWLKKQFSRLFMWFLKQKKFDLSRACIMVVGFEGDKAEILRKKRLVQKIASTHGGVDLGTSVGKKWFAGKYDYPYLRDFFMDYGGMVDVTETAVIWSDVISTHQRVQSSLKSALQNGNLQGYVGCHVSHSYTSGACLYFTFATMSTKGYEFEQYQQAKNLAVNTILDCGGALSHHHAIGYEHQPWYADYIGETALQALQALKASLDPNGICNPGKLFSATIKRQATEPMYP